jgi:hypothetical protein
VEGELNGWSVSMKDSVLKDLDHRLKELNTDHPALEGDRLFTAWFIHAYILEDLDESISAVTGQTNDKNADAIVIDPATKTVSIVQAKYRKKLMVNTEKANDLYSFAGLAHYLYLDSDDEFRAFLNTAAASVAQRLREARKCLSQGGWTLSLIYVTLGKATPGVVEQAELKVRKASKSATFEFINGERLILLLRDYLDGAAPPVSSVELPVDSGEGVVVKGAMNRFDAREGIETWVFPANGADIGRLFIKHGRRIFARNVRGFMGAATSVNREMSETIQHHPARFFYLNNGLTIVCDAAEKTEKDGRDVVRIANPQIINGQQTTRSLAEAFDAAHKTSVMVRVIRIPRNVNSDHDRFESLVTKIVQGTNWQNAISQADLMSNDRRQIQLERAFRAKGYIYLRKREKKGDAHKKGFSGKFSIKKEELARAVAGCTLDPAVVRAGVDNLFSEERYGEIFPNSSLEYYLPKYWVMKAVNAEIGGEPRRGYMKWLAMYFVWSQLKGAISRSVQQRIFWEEFQKPSSYLHDPVGLIARQAFSAIGAFYRDNKWTTDDEGNQFIQDESNFFKNRRELPASFMKYWRNRKCTPHRRRIARALKKIETVLECAP